MQTEEIFEIGKKYWIENFERSNSFNILDFIGKSKQNTGVNFSHSYLDIEQDINSKLLDQCNESDWLIYTYFLAVINISFMKLSNSNYIVTGVPTTKESNETNIIPLFVTLDKSESFKDLLLNIHEELSIAHRYNSLPLDVFINDLKDNGNSIEKSIDYFDTVVLFNSIHGDKCLENSSKPFVISINKNDGKIGVTFKYNSTMVESWQVEKFVERFYSILDTVINNVELKLSEINIIKEKELNLLLNDFNNTASLFPDDKTLHLIFEEQVKKTPDNVALIFENKTLTYEELNSFANQFARKLQENEIGIGSVVPIILERSLEMMIGIMGIMKAGAAYLPINPNHPTERIKYLLDDCNSKMIVTTVDLENKLELTIKMISIDTANLSTYSKDNLVTTKSTDLAYVIYTSGSTGNPKGVMVEHKSVINRLNWMKKMYPLTEEDIILQKTPFTFDVSVWELFLWQMTGTKLCILSPNEEKNPAKILETINKNKVTILHFVPSMLESFLQYYDNYGGNNPLKNIKYLFTSGEALKKSQVEKTKEIFKINIINMYGPTEATIEVTYYNCGKEDIKSSVPIGRPIDNTKIYIFDRNKEISPIGIMGEICIAGNGLARGYLNKPELTREKFVDNPLFKGEKIYKTGDLGRWLPDGNVEYLGRIDDQVKIRGYRVELGEIESVLLKYNGIQEVAVIAKEDNVGDLKLVAIIKGVEINKSSIRNFLYKKLPDYMIPQEYIKIDKMPVNSNGKLDRKMLLKFSKSKVTRNVKITPSNEIEKELINMWKKILSIEEIGTTDNFFELGGHSLKAINLIAQINKQWNVMMSLESIFENPTILSLGEMIVQGEFIKYESIKPTSSQEFYPASSQQKRLFVLNQLSQGISYNMPLVLEINGRLNTDKLESTIKTLIDRHELLRSSYEVNSDDVVLKVEPSLEFKLNTIELPEPNVDKFIEDFVRPFNLHKSPLIRIQLGKLGEDCHLLMFDIHHIISDGITMNILMKEFMDIYNGEVLEPLQIQYKDYSSWFKEQLNLGKFKKQEQYWLRQFEKELPVLDLQYDYQRPKVQDFKGNRLGFSISSNLTKKIKSLSENTNSTLYMILLSAYTIMLSKYTEQEDIVVGTPVSGRIHPDLQSMAGLFMNTLGIRTSPKRNKNFLSYLREVRDTSLKAFENQEYPFEELVDKLDLIRDVSRNPIFDTMFVLQNMDTTKVELKELHISQYPYTPKVSKFDLTIDAEVKDDRIQFFIEYNSNLFNDDTIYRMADHYIKILEEITLNPEQLIDDINMLTHKEKRQIIEDNNSTKEIVDRKSTVQKLFEEQVKINPNKIAIVYEGIELTYDELNSKANQVANYLKSRYEIKPNSLIGIMMERTEQIVVTILGVLKTGAAYVPIDPTYPHSRINYIVEDSGLEILITEEKYLTDSKNLNATIELVFLNDEAEKVNHSLPTNLDLSSEPSDLAYVIYTSGSTGNPKGVMVNQMNIINFFKGMDKCITYQESDVFLSVTTISFDISVLELFWTLTHGLTVVLRDSNEFKMSYDRYIEPQNIEMDFSLFFFSSYSQTDENEKYKLLLDTAKFADQNNFKALWTPERHFHEFGGIYPNPSITSAALAMITNNVEIRSGSIVSPLHDSINIAEDWAVVDNLSNGRIGISFASGWHPDDFVFNPEVYSERAKTMFEQINEVQKLWKGEKIKKINGAGKEIEVETFPRPIQEQLPVWVTSAGNKDTFKKAGEIGANILTHLLGQDLSILEENIKVYRKSLVENGFEPNMGKVTVMLHTYIGENLDEVKEKIRIPFCDYLRTSINLVEKISEELQFNISDFNSKDDFIDALIDVAFERYWQTSALMGTPKSCIKIVEKLKSIGINEIACLVDFGLSENEVIKGLQNLVNFKDSITKPINKKSNPVSMIQITPSRLNLLLEDSESKKFLKSLSTILIGGEPLSDELIRKIKVATNANIYNMYGPTETTIWSSVCKIEGSANNNNIGKPIANTKIYILNERQSLLPIGIVGEIYIGGDGVSAGYLGKEELTKDKFINLNINNESPERLYRTGDLGRVLSDGTIQFKGRNDNMVKIRGYRVELGEIENILLKSKLIKNVAVIEQNDSDSEVRIIAFYTANDEIKIEHLRDYLYERLPFYMIPSLFIKLATFPLTPNGKIDRVTLKNKNVDNVLVTSSTIGKPRNEVEVILISVWEQVLGNRNIGIHDDFFQLGGDSIKAIQVSSRLRNYSLEVDIRKLFKYPTIAFLSPYVKEGKKSISQSVVEGEVPLTPIQSWFFERYGNNRGQNHFNHSVMLYGKNGFQEKLVREVFNKIVEHHDALRMVYKEFQGKFRQYNRGLEGKLFNIKTFDYRNQENGLDLLKLKMKELQGGNNLGYGPLIQLGLFKLKEGDHLLIIIHHLVIDGVSWRIILEDFNTGYIQTLNRNILEFPTKTDSFKDWSNSLRKLPFDNNLNYWVKIAEHKSNQLPTDYTIENNKVKDTFRISNSLDAVNTEMLLKQSNIPYGTETSDLLLSALGLTLKNWTENSTFKIDLESHGRESNNYEISRTVGWFTSMFPAILDITKLNDYSSLIKRVKEMQRNIPNLGIGYGVNKFILNPQEFNKENNPEILFNYLGQFDEDIKSKTFDISEIEVTNTISDELERLYKLEINLMINNGELLISVDFNRLEYKLDTIQEIINNYINNLKNIIEHCITKSEVELTLSDLTHKNITEDEVSHLLSNTNVQDIYNLSPMQKGILFHSSIEKDSSSYFQQFILDISGYINEAEFKKSFDILISSHDILRTNFLYLKNKSPLQVVLRKRNSEMNFIDISKENTDSYLDSFLISDRERNFNLETDSLIRITVIQTSESTYQLIFSYHHIIIDGWGMALISKKLLNIYSRLINNKPIELNTNYQFKSYISWLNEQSIDKASMYWKDYFLDYEKKNILINQDNKLNKKHLQVDYLLKLGLDESRKLREIAMNNKTTLSTVISTAWGILLQKLNNTNDIVFGTVVSGRPVEIDGIEETIGIFINTIPFRVQTDGDLTFTDLTNKIQINSLKSEKYNYYPLYEIQKNSIVLDHILVFENYPLQNELMNIDINFECGFTIDNVEVFEQTNYDFNLIIENHDELVFKFRFNTEVFEQSYVQRISNYFSSILNSITNNPKVLISDIDIVDSQEKELYLSGLLDSIEFE